MTAADIITLVREQMNDTEREYRFSDEELLRATDEVHQELLFERPSLKLQADGTYQTVSSITATTDALIPDEKHRDAMASAVCHKIYKKDAEDDINLGLSNFHRQNYVNEI